MKLYTIIFDLLIGVMTWYHSRWNRVKASFNNQSLTNIVTNKRKIMGELGAKMNREAELITQRKIRDMPSAGDLQANFDAMREWMATNLGPQVQVAVREQFASIVYQAQQQPYLLPGSQPFRRSLSPTASLMTMEGSTSTVHIQDAVAELRRYQQDELIDSLVQRSLSLSLNSEVFQRIQHWLAENVSQTLWIQGPFGAAKPSRYTITSACMIGIARKFKIPAIAFFCDDLNGPHDAEEVEGLRMLLLSLVSQLAGFLDQEVDTTPDLSPERFDCLSGAETPLPEAIALLKDLLAIGPHILFIVIDNIQTLAYGLSDAEMKCLSELIELLALPKDSGVSSSNIIKTFFTTDGFFDELTCIPPDSRLNALNFELENETGVERDTVMAAMLGI
jgi:hypothetical protein